MDKKRLGDIATYINGYAFKPSDWRNKGLPIIRIQDLTGTSYQLNFYDGEYPGKIEINNGDVLISWSGSLGIYIWNSGKALLNQHIFKVEFNKIQIDKQYFVYAVKYNLATMISKMHGATMKHIVKKDFDNIKVPYPSIKEQKEFVNRLLKIESAIDARKRQLEALDNLIKARFVEMFGDPIINPMDWPVCELSEHIEFLTSGSRGWAKYFTGEGEYFITIKNVKNCRIILDEVQHIIPPDNAEAKRTRVQEGDLLISITADLGRTAVVTKDVADYGGYINQHLTCIRLNKTVVCPLYAAYYMESEAGKKQFQSKNQSAVKAGLNFNSINTLKLMVPPLELQNQFAAFVAQTDKSKVAIQKSLDETQLLFDSLTQEYFGCHAIPFKYKI